MNARTRRAATRGVSLMEAASGVAILGSLLAVAIPVFARELHESRLVEAANNVTRIGAAAVEHANGRPVAEAFPPSAPLTPAVVPRGARAASAEGAADGAWVTPTWTALAFRPGSSSASTVTGTPTGSSPASAAASEKTPIHATAQASAQASEPALAHAFAYAFDSSLAASRSTFVARAHGDLDGDGLTSTFEVRGAVSTSERARLEPGMYVEAELE